MIQNPRDDSWNIYVRENRIYFQHVPFKCNTLFEDLERFLFESAYFHVTFCVRRCVGEQHS